MGRSLGFAFLLALALPAFAGHASRDLFIPVVGRALRADGTGFFTALWITNVSPRPAQITLDFYAASEAKPAASVFAFPLASGESRHFNEVDARILGRPERLGALRVRSNEPVVATAKTYGNRLGAPMSMSSSGAVFDGIPAAFALGNRQTSFVHGIVLASPEEQRNKLYIVETRGEPLTFSVAAIGAHGETLAQRVLYIRAHESMVLDLANQFGNVTGTDLGLRVRGMNGDGRVIFAAGAVTAVSGDANGFEMEFPEQPRFAMPRGEIAAYVAVALAIVAAMFIYAQQRS